MSDVEDGLSHEAIRHLRKQILTARRHHLAALRYLEDALGVLRGDTVDLPGTHGTERVVERLLRQHRQYQMTKTH